MTAALICLCGEIGVQVQHQVQDAQNDLELKTCKPEASICKPEAYKIYTSGLRNSNRGSGFKMYYIYLYFFIKYKLDFQVLYYIKNI